MIKLVYKVLKFRWDLWRRVMILTRCYCQHHLIITTHINDDDFFGEQAISVVSVDIHPPKNKSKYVPFMSMDNANFYLLYISNS